MEGYVEYQIPSVRYRVYYTRGDMMTCHSNVTWKRSAKLNRVMPAREYEIGDRGETDRNDLGGRLILSGAPTRRHAIIIQNRRRLDDSVQRTTRPKLINSCTE